MVSRTVAWGKRCRASMGEGGEGETVEERVGLVEREERLSGRQSNYQMYLSRYGCGILAGRPIFAATSDFYAASAMVSAMASTANITCC